MHSVRSRLLLSSAVLLFPLVLACERQEEVPPATDAAPAELITASERYVAAWNGSDPAAVAAFHTEDATVTDPDSSWQGRAAIEAGWVQQYQPVLSNLHATETSWDRLNGDWREHGRYTVMMSLPDAEPSEAPGSYSHDWTQDASGEWRIRSSDIRPDSPPPQS
jgi:uncharacterized protein (TIGR02246 family)